MTHHKYLDDNDILYSDNNETIVYITKESNFFRSKQLHYGRDAGFGKLSFRGYLESVSGNVFCVFGGGKDFKIDNFNLYRLNALSLTILKDFVTKIFSKENIERFPDFRRWINHLTRYFLEDDPGCFTGPLFDQDKEKVFVDYLETIWRFVLTDYDIEKIHFMMRLDIPDHYYLGPRYNNQPRYEFKDSTCTRYLHFHDFERELIDGIKHRIIWVNLDSEKSITMTQNPLTPKSEGMLECVVLVGYSDTVSWVRENLVKHYGINIKKIFCVTIQEKIYERTMYMKHDELSSTSRLYDLPRNRRNYFLNE